MDWKNYLKNSFRKIEETVIKVKLPNVNMAGRLTENSHNSFVDLQCKRFKKTGKNSLFIKKGDFEILIRNLYNLLLFPLAALK